MDKTFDQVARERAMDKIRKLLALAADKSNEHEAANATSQAEKLMRHYQIDSSEVTLKELEQDEEFTQDMEKVSFENVPEHKSVNAPNWVGYIAIGCGEAFTCKVDLVNTPEGLRARFSGYHLDVMLCKWVYRFLCETVYKLSKEHCKGLGMSAAKSFRIGAASVIQNRLFKLKAERDQENQAAPTGTGLVIYNRKEERVKEMFGETQKKSHRNDPSDYNSYMGGKSEGEKVQIPTNRPLEAGQ